MAENKFEESKSIQEESTLITIKLRKPTQYNGKEYTELSFDFDKLTGADGLNIQAELRQEGLFSPLPAGYNEEYLIRMAARACTEPIGADIANFLSIRDSNAIIREARAFLLSTAE